MPYQELREVRTRSAKVIGSSSRVRGTSEQYPSVDAFSHSVRGTGGNYTVSRRGSGCPIRTWKPGGTDPFLQKCDAHSIV
jgi:hypothetical protein